MSLKSRVLEHFASPSQVGPKRSLGQNFLINSEVVSKIILSLPKFLEHAIEIGPGLGALTEDLMARDLKSLKLIELDSEFAARWRQDGRAEVVECDALQWDWSEVVNRETTGLVSNLPYQISTSLVVDRCLDEEPFFCMVLMFQKEVAERLMAKPNSKDYGALSVIAQSVFRLSRVVDADPKSFYPPPRVASRVLKFEVNKGTVLPNLDKKKFFDYLKASFHQRRKLLAKNLASAFPQVAIEKSFQSLQIAVQARAQELSPLQHRELFLKLKDFVDVSEKGGDLA